MRRSPSPPHPRTTGQARLISCATRSVALIRPHSEPSRANLVGIVGICRDRSEKGAHKCSIWGLYVSPHARSKGIGRALVTEALGFARSLEGVTHVFVSATDRAPEAIALYEGLGFITWGVEPAAVRIGDVAVSEQHMVRTSDGGSA